MNKTIDFDGYREEQKEEKLTIKAYGEDIELPASPRLSIMEDLIDMKNKEGKEATVPEEEVINMLDALMGADVRKKLSKNGATIKEMEWLLMQIWQKYNTGEQDDTKNQTNSTSQKTGD